MSETKRILPTEIDLAVAGRTPAGTKGGDLPSVLADKGARRLRAIAIVAICAASVAWGVVNLAQGEFLDEFATPWQWGGPVLSIAASIAILVAGRTRRITSTRMVNLGLFYQVLMSYSFVIGAYWGAFRGITPRLVNEDVVGYSNVAIWMLCFTILVPARPRNALLALIGSASAAPLTILMLIRSGDMPAIGAGQFISTFCMPYLFCAGLAYYISRILYGLGRDLHRARQMGSYHLADLIGRGGMGEVWRARHKLLARPAAIKLIRRDSFASRPGVWENLTGRFEKEAQATAALESPHSVSLYDFGMSDDGTLYYVMELLEGIDLETLLERHGPQEPSRVIHILKQICLSLEEAHLRGLIHRDIKPGNILLCRQAFEYDFTKVLDFGLVKQIASFGDGAEAGETAIGTITGTPGYLAPELVTGETEPDGRSDLYSLGCVAYWLLTGKRVFDEPSPLASIIAHANRQPSPPSAQSELDIPPELDALVLGCLAKSPANRPASAGDLRTILADIPTKAWDQNQAERWWQNHMEATRP